MEPHMEFPLGDGEGGGVAPYGNPFLCRYPYDFQSCMPSGYEE